MNKKFNFQPRANRFARKNSQGGQSSIYSPAPEYDDPANYAPEEDQYRRCNPYGMINHQNVNIFIERHFSDQSGGGSLYCPEYDDPANCAAEEDQYRQAGDLYGENICLFKVLNSYKLTSVNHLSHHFQMIQLIGQNTSNLYALRIINSYLQVALESDMYCHVNSAMLKNYCKR